MNLYLYHFTLLYCIITVHEDITWFFQNTLCRRPFLMKHSNYFGLATLWQSHLFPFSVTGLAVCCVLKGNRTKTFLLVSNLIHIFVSLIHCSSSDHYPTRPVCLHLYICLFFTSPRFIVVTTRSLFFQPTLHCSVPHLVPSSTSFFLLIFSALP